MENPKPQPASESRTAAPVELLCKPQNSRKAARPLPATEERYREALDMYAATTLSVQEICHRCDVRPGGFRKYLQSYRRDLLMARYGIRCSTETAMNVRLRKQRGQTPAAQIKYREAVAACDDAAYIEYNVSQIARCFGLDPTGLGNQLRLHYPDILERREQMRRRLGIGDNQQRGARRQCSERYAGAVELLRTTQKTVFEAAEVCGVSPTGLRQHVEYYHKDLMRRREEERGQAAACRRPGEITGNGRRHKPLNGMEERYREALHLYRTAPLTLRQIADKARVSFGGFHHYLRTWHRDDLFARRGMEYREGAKLEQKGLRLKSTAAKYADAIGRLRESRKPVSAVAAEFGFNPDTFRNYIRKYEPELRDREGMTTRPDGKQVLRRSMERYAEAIRLYETTGEPLKSIARKLALPYASLGGFVRRNYPELLAAHKQQRLTLRKASPEPEAPLR